MSRNTNGLGIKRRMWLILYIASLFSVKINFIIGITLLCPVRAPLGAGERMLSQYTGAQLSGPASVSSQGAQQQEAGWEAEDLVPQSGTLT